MRIGPLPAVLIPALLLAGCAETDPYLRPGQWQPTGANAINLAAMVANPHDLLRGRGTNGTPAVEAAPPIQRYWSGNRTALPTTSTQTNGLGQGRPAAGAAGGDSK